MTSRPGPVARPPLAPAVAAAAAGVCGVALAASALRSTLALSASYAPTATVLALGIAAVALPGVRRHHPFARYGPANAATAFRAALVTLVGGAVGEAPLAPLLWTLVAIASAAALLDLADGWLARRSGIRSGFGARFDMEVDALLIVVLSALDWRFGKAGAWILLAGLLRYLFVAAAWPWPWMAAPLPPSRRRQTVCVVQIVTLIAALAPVVSRPFSDVVAGAGLAALVWSFWLDTRGLAAGARGGATAS